MLNKLIGFFKSPSVSSVLATYQKTITDLHTVAQHHADKQVRLAEQQDKLLAQVDKLQEQADLSWAEAHLAFETINKFNKFLK